MRVPGALWPNRSSASGWSLSSIRGAVERRLFRAPRTGTEEAGRIVLLAPLSMPCTLFKVEAHEIPLYRGIAGLMAADEHTLDPGVELSTHSNDPPAIGIGIYADGEIFAAVTLSN